LAVNNDDGSNESDYVIIACVNYAI